MDSVAWVSNLDGFLDVGYSLSLRLVEGTHTITFTGADEHGGEGTDSITLTIAPDPVDLPPSVFITWPNFDALAGSSHALYGSGSVGYAEIIFEGGATDTEDGDLTGSSLVWTTDQTDLQSATLGTGTDITVRLYNPDASTVHKVTLTATDSGGNVRSFVRYVEVWTLL